MRILTRRINGGPSWEHVMAANDLTSADEAEPSSPGPTSSAIIRYLAALLLTAFATVIAVGVDMQMAIPNLSLVFVIPVIISGVGLGLGPSLLSAVAGVALYDFFLTAPRLSLAVDDPANIWALCLLFIVGLVASTVSFTARRRARETAALEQQLTALRNYSQDIATAVDHEAIASRTCRAVASLFDLPAVAIIIEEGQAPTIRMWGDLKPNDAEINTAQLSLLNDEVVHSGVYPNLDNRFDLWPFKTKSGVGAVIGVAFDADDRPSAADKSIATVGSILMLSLER
jgi:K+-sensing histidine kinase KdpD